MVTTVKRKDIPPQRRKQIIDAALELFAHSGYHGVTVDAIAQRAGISKGNLYWYFRSKQEIFQLLIDHIVERVFTLVAEIMESDEPPRDKLRALAQGCLDAADADSRAVHLMWQIVTHPELKDLLSSEFRLWFDPFIDHLTRLFTQIGEKEPEGVAMLYAFTLDALIFLVIVSPDIYDREKLMAALEYKFINAIGGEDA